MSTGHDASAVDVGGPSVAIDVDRLATSVEGLAARSGGAVGADLHALAGIIRNLASEPVEGRDALAQALRDAMDAADEPAAVVAAQRLAAADRSRVVPIDWTAASGG